jgi:hypothetical protein
MMSRGRHFKDYEEWLWSEMAKTIPVSLSLRNDLEHYWADKYTPSMPTNMANLVARFRTKTAEAACEQLDATQLCRLLSGVRSWVLYHLVAGTGNTSSDMPVWKEWQWIGPVLLKGIAVCPCTMIPQAANLFIKSDNRIHRSAAEGGEHSAGSHIEWVYSVKKEWIKELFPDLKARSQFVKAMLQSAECEDQWPLDTRCMVQQARQELAHSYGHLLLHSTSSNLNTSPRPF